MDELALQAVRDTCRALDMKFGGDIVALDIGDVSVVADCFIIATGGSAPQIQALADTAEEVLGRHGYPLRHTEGLRAANWVLLDFGDIIVHLFDKASRQFYNLERVWGDAKIVTSAPAFVK